ncbi:hypothetical protein [Desulfosarcina variabilis]|uniref:hypothetical protein n=1 Tax=Desulfosarcina variabilis TaxID=2300 RepID=UPI003AFAEB59
MDQKQMFKQLVECNQTMFNDFFQALTLFQSQFEPNANSAVDQDETRKALENWDKSFVEE